MISIPPAVSPHAQLAIRGFYFAFFSSPSIRGLWASWGMGALQTAAGGQGQPRGVWHKWVWGACGSPALLCVQRFGCRGSWEAWAVFLWPLKQGIGQKGLPLSSLCLCSSQVKVSFALNIWPSEFNWLVWARSCCKHDWFRRKAQSLGVFPSWLLFKTFYFHQSSSTVEIVPFVLKQPCCCHMWLCWAQAFTCVTCYMIELWTSGEEPHPWRPLLRTAYNPCHAGKPQQEEEQRLLIGSQRLHWFQLALEMKD